MRMSVLAPVRSRRVPLLTALAVVGGLATAEPLAPRPDEDARIVHALERLGYDPRPGDVEKVRAIGLDRWIESQLHPDRIPDRELPARLAALRTVQAKVLRAVYSERQLEEVLVDFWMNHFNVFAQKGPEKFLLADMDQPPTGYKDVAEAWVSTGGPLARLNFALDLAAGRLAGVPVDPSALAPEASTNHDVVATLAARVAGLILGSPEFQRR